MELEKINDKYIIRLDDLNYIILKPLERYNDNQYYSLDIHISQALTISGKQLDIGNRDIDEIVKDETFILMNNVIELLHKVKDELK